MNLITKNINKIFLAIIIIGTLSSCQKEEMQVTTFISVKSILSVDELGFREIIVEYTHGGVESYEVSEFHDSSEEVLDFAHCLGCVGNGFGFFGLTEQEIEK